MGLSESKITPEISSTLEAFKSSSLKPLLKECPSNSSGHCNHLGTCLKTNSEAEGLDQGTRLCISNDPQGIPMLWLLPTPFEKQGPQMAKERLPGHLY